MEKGLSLQKMWDSFDTYTGKTSDIARQLSFAGIAIIWIFKTGDSFTQETSERFLWPLLWFVITLALDFLQYVAGSLTWYFYARAREKEQRKTGGINLDQEYDPPDCLLWPIYILFWSKNVVISMGYFSLLKHVKHFLLL